MTKFAFRVAVAVLVVTMIALLSVIGKQNPEALAQRAKQEELVKAKQKLEAEKLERLRKSPEFQKDVARLTLAKQFPGGVRHDA
jgi:hypothetical protein